MPQFNETTLFYIFLAIIICYAFYFFEKTNENKIIFATLSVYVFLKFLVEEAYLPRGYGAFSILLTLPIILFKNDFFFKQKILLCFYVILIFVAQLLLIFKILSILGLVVIQTILTLVFLLCFLKMTNDMLYERKLLILYFVSLSLFLECTIFYSVFFK